MKINYINKSNFPDKLLNIFNVPDKIFYSGDINLLFNKSIAVIGTRKPTIYGINSTKYFVKEFVSSDIVIISGLAYGIDSIAHETALECKGKTIAVLAHGLDTVYPSKNKKLVDTILEKGGLIMSEYDIKTEIKPYMFLERSRIITGISDGVFIPECDIKGGTVSAAVRGFNQNAYIYALPHDIDRVKSQGTNRLISQNIAQLVNSPYDVLVDMGIKAAETASHKIQLTNEESQIIEALSDSSQTLEALSLKLDMLLSQVVAVVSGLEMRNLIIRNFDFSYTIRKY